MPKTLMQSVIGQLEKERKRLEQELHGVTAALSAFGKAYMKGSKADGRRGPRVGRRPKRTLSVAARRRIAAAQRARWAKIKAAKK